MQEKVYEALRQMGENLADEAALAFMAGINAGVVKAGTVLREVAEGTKLDSAEREQDIVLTLADRIEKRREELTAQLADATGLRAKGIERRLAQLNAAEQEAIDRLALDEAPSTAALPETKDGTVLVERDANDRRRKPSGVDAD